MRIKNLPTTSWDLEDYDLDYYGYGDVDIFTDKSLTVGERVWCIFRKKDIEKYQDDECYEQTVAILCNDCGYESGIPELEGLNAGQIIPVNFNGNDNPTIPLDWIKNKFWKME